MREENAERRWRSVGIWQAGQRLRALLRERKALWQAIREAPVEPLEIPYRRGWDRWFEWTPEARRRKDFASLEKVLEIVQQREWNRYPDFRRWDRDRRRYLPAPHEVPHLSIAEALRRCRDEGLMKYFETSRYRPMWSLDHLRQLRLAGWGGLIRFSHPELLQSRVEPHWITHRRIRIPEAESRLAEIESFIEHHGGREAIDHLLGRRRWRPTMGCLRDRAVQRAMIRDLRNEMSEREQGAGDSAPFSFSGAAVVSGGRIVQARRVTLEVSTPALLFPAISLLFLSFTNRFLHLAALIRQLYRDWQEKGDELLRAQINNLRRRLSLIRAMQLLGAVSLFCCVASMVAVTAGMQHLAIPAFVTALLLMGGSLGCLCYEVWISGGALRILLREIEKR